MIVFDVNIIEMVDFLDKRIEGSYYSSDEYRFKVEFQISLTIVSHEIDFILTDCLDFICRIVFKCL